jgi:hypothetical protein
MKLLALAATVTTLFTWNPASAAGDLIPAPERRDMVHDFSRNRLYISNGAQLLRYDLSTQSFLEPLALGGVLSGMDISLDGDTLAVADQSYSATEGWIHLVDLRNDQAQRVAYPLASYEGGSWTVAFGADHKAYVTTMFRGSGWVPFRSYDPSTQAWQSLASLRQNSMAVASADGNTIAYVESNSSSGPLGMYRVQTGERIPLASTNWFTYEVGVNSNGTQFAVPTYGGTFIYDDNHNQLGLLGTYAGPQPIGAVYHPVESRVYFPWTGSTSVREYDTTTLTQIGSYDFQDNFTHQGNWALRQGRMKISRDGSLLMATVSGGVRVVKLYEGLRAEDFDVSGDEDAPLPITLSGMIGNGGQLNFAITRSPMYGSLSGTAPDLVYTPNANVNGFDEIAYEVSYGPAKVAATMQIEIAPINDAPVAIHDSATVRRGKAVVIAVLNNDTDIDGDALSIQSVSKPKYGVATVSADGKSITYSHDRRFRLDDVFSYTLTDGNGGSATAQINVTVLR